MNEAARDTSQEADHEYLSTPEEMAAYAAEKKRQAARRLAAVDDSARDVLRRLADTLHRIEDGTLGAEEAYIADDAGFLQAYRYGYLQSSARGVLEEFGLYEGTGK